MLTNHYVFQTVNSSGQHVYYHSVTRDVLPVGASESELRAGFYLMGQERDAVEHVLFACRDYTSAHLGIVPTWECNLRCTHCVVKHRLMHHQESVLDVALLEEFMQRWVSEKGLLYLSVGFYGGESLLALDKCLEIIDAVQRLPATTYVSTVTNLSMDLTNDHITYLSRLNTIGISVDGGNEVLHNRQRLAYGANFNPYQKMIGNLKRLIFAGLRDKIMLQCCLPHHETVDKNIAEFLTFGFKLGLRPDQIKIGTELPSEVNPEPTQSFKNEVKFFPSRRTACCKYRFNVYQTDFTGTVYSDAYTYSPLGTWKSPIVDLEDQKVELSKQLCLLTDEKCKTCPVLGYCWAGCCKMDVTGKKWSDFCNQEGLIDMTVKFGENNKLIDYDRNKFREEEE